MIKVFLFVVVMIHGQMQYKLAEASSKSACEAARPEILKQIIERDAPDSIDVKCVEVTLATVS